MVWKILLIIILVLVVAYLITCLILGYKNIKKYMVRQPNYIETSNQEDLDKYGIDFDWLSDKEIETWALKSFDNTKVMAKYIKNPNGGNKVVILHHGHGVDYRGMIPYAKMYYAMGYNLLMNDSRCSGESEGNLITFGINEQKDLQKWIDQIVFVNGKDVQIVIHGVSMGAATACMVSKYDNSKYVKAIISDCAYSTMFKQTKNLILNEEKSKNSKFLSKNYVVNCIVFSIFMGTWILKGVNLFKCQPEEDVSKATSPILFIHGDQDNYVPYAMMDELYNNCCSEKEEITINNAKHALSIMFDPNKYFEVVNNFLNDKIK